MHKADTSMILAQFTEIRIFAICPKVSLDRTIESCALISFGRCKIIFIFELAYYTF